MVIRDKLTDWTALFSDHHFIPEHLPTAVVPWGVRVVLGRRTVVVVGWWAVIVSGRWTVVVVGRWAVVVVGWWAVVVYRARASSIIVVVVFPAI